MPCPVVANVEPATIVQPHLQTTQEGSYYWVGALWCQPLLEAEKLSDDHIRSKMPGRIEHIVRHRARLLQPALRDQHGHQDELAERSATDPFTRPERDDPLRLAARCLEIAELAERPSSLVGKGSFIEPAYPGRGCIVWRLSQRPSA